MPYFDEYAEIRFLIEARKISKTKSDREKEI